MRNDTITITRGQLGGWLGVIGGAALLAGFVGLIWQGSFGGVVAVALGVGAVGIVLWALLNPQDARGLLTGRQTRYGTLAVVLTFLLIGIIALTYIFVARSSITIDLTQNNRFTLSEETARVLERIERPIQITGFYSPAGLRLRQVDDQFFRQYTTASNGRVEIVYIDPEEQPAQAQRFGVTFDGALFISYLNEDGSVDFSTLARVPRSENQERDVTEAISRLLIAGEVTVFFEVSYGGLDPTDPEQTGLSGVNNGIRESGLITYPLSLVELLQNGQRIPDEAAAIIMPRLTAPFDDQTVALVDDYLQRGGALFIMADPIFREPAFLREDDPFNTYLWENYGIRARDQVVVDYAASGDTPLDILSAAVYPETDIAARLNPETDPVQFRIARAVEVDDTPPPDVANGRIILSSPESYGETDWQTLAETNSFAFDESADVPGPLTTVAWAWNQENDSRILLIGDSDFATNGQVLTGGNGVLFTDGLTWLTGYGERITFGTQFYSIGLPLIFIDTSTRDAISFVTIILMPGIMLLAAVIVWVRRMRA